MSKLSTVATLVLLALSASIAHPAFAGDGSDQTAQVTFMFVFPVDPWADVDQDGVPDPLPDPLSLLFDELQVIVVGPQEDFADSRRFISTSLPCGPYALSSTTWTCTSYARVVQSGRPRDLLLYAAPGGQRPAYRSAILPGDVVSAAACWIKEDSYGYLAVQEEYNLNTSAAVVIVTVEVRVE